MSWDEVKCKCEVWSVGCEECSVKCEGSVRLELHCTGVLRRSCHVLGQQQSNTCKFYRWERSSSITLRQLPPRLVRVLLVCIYIYIFVCVWYISISIYIYIYLIYIYIYYNPWVIHFLVATFPVKRLLALLWPEVRIQRHHFGLWPHWVWEVWQPRGWKMVCRHEKLNFSC